MLHAQLKAARNKMSIASDVIAVVIPYFDQYLIAAIAPASPLMGISKTLLEFFFKVLRHERRRDTLETHLYVYLSLIGLPKQTYIYNKGTVGIHSMYMTSVISLLMISRSIADAYFTSSDILQQCQSQLKTLQTNISCAYCWPLEAIDGSVASPFIVDSGRSCHNRERKTLECK